MNTKKDSMNDLYGKLLLFDSNLIELFTLARSNIVHEFETFTKLDLPQDYIDFLHFTNGMSLMGDIIYGIYPEDTKVPFNLMVHYHIEHTEVDNVMYPNLIPFSPDGFGNHYCFDTIANNIVFWQHDYNYFDDKPDFVCDSFTDFLRDIIIGWTLEEYDYHGNPKRK